MSKSQQRLTIILISLFFILEQTPCFAASKDAETIKILRAKAVESEFSGNYESALQFYDQALALASKTYGSNSPFLSELFYDMGVVALYNSQFEQAQDCLTQAIRLNPNSNAAQLKLSELLRLRGKPDEAIKHAKVVANKHKNDMWAHEELACSYQEKGDNLRALKEFSKLENLLQLEKARYAHKAPPAKLTPIPKQIPEPVNINQNSNLKDKSADEKNKKELEKAKKDALEKELREKELKARKEKEEKNKSEKQRKVKQEQKKPVLNKQSKPTKSNQSSPPDEQTGEEITLSGLPAKLKSKAVLLTPTGKKKSVSSESSGYTYAEPQMDESAAEEAPPAKKIQASKPVEAKAEALTIKPIKRGRGAAGLVPPPPPVIPSFGMSGMMAPPPPIQSPPLSKPKITKIEKAKPKERPPDSQHEEKGGGAEEDDFLLDWGGAKKK